MEQFWIFLSRVNPNVDFGNLFVGLATLVLAATTIFLALRSSRNEARITVASFRQKWVDELRVKFVSYNKLIHSILAVQLTGRHEDGYREKFVAISIDINEVQSSILLMLNPRESVHKHLYKKMDEVSDRIMDLSRIKKEDQSGLNKGALEIRMMRREVLNLQKKTLKIEWDRVRAEIHGHSAIRRWLSRHLKGKPDLQYDWWLDENNNSIEKE